MALVCDVLFCHFTIGILGQVWYLIVSIPDLCHLSYCAISMCILYIRYIFLENSKH